MAAMNLSLTLKQSRANAIAAALGAGALIRIYSGSIPATPETAATGTLLSTLTGNGSAFAGAAVTNGLNNLVIGAAGAGYATAPAVSFTGGGGSGATAVAEISGGAVVNLIITNPGSGYTSAPTVVFTGGGFSTVATATAVLGVVLSANAITQDSSAVASGTGGYARLVAAGAATGAAGIVDMDVGAVGSTAAMHIVPATITAGAPVTCSSLLIEEG